MPYAERTEVPVSRSKAEIEHLVTRYGATRFASYVDECRAAIIFEAGGRRIRFVLPLPARAAAPSQRAHEQEQRRIWRALCLVIKAKLESVESGIETLEESFLAQLVLPDDSTVGETIAPLVAEAYATRRMPALMPALGLPLLPPPRG